MGLSRHSICQLKQINSPPSSKAMSSAISSASFAFSMRNCMVTNLYSNASHSANTASNCFERTVEICVARPWVSVSERAEADRRMNESFKQANCGGGRDASFAATLSRRSVGFAGGFLKMVQISCVTHAAGKSAAAHGRWSQPSVSAPRASRADGTHAPQEKSLTED